MPRKKLSVDALAVESFETAARVESPRGTVHAHGFTGFTSYCQCQYATSYGTCQGTCVDTCGGETCDDPCLSTDTFYQTCQAGCSWTDGYAVCIEPASRDVC